MTGIVIPVLKRKLIYIRAHAREQRNKDKSSKNTELRNKTDKTDKLMRNKTKTYDYGSSIRKGKLTVLYSNEVRVTRNFTVLK